jgi:C1A family cysteine protease
MIFAEDSIVFKKFTEFTHKYNKVYSSVEEFQTRFENFKNNLIEILAADDFSGAHTKGITKFSDLSKTEFKNKYLTLKHQAGWCQSSAKFGLRASEPIPESLDYRTTGKVSPIKDQGACGSCWAFSTVAFLESQSLIKSNKALTFSEQQLVDCDRDQDAGCNGGLMQTAFNYIAEKGIESDKSYPYKARDQTCKYNEKSVVTKVSNVQCYEDVAVKDIKTYLAKVGPLAIAVDATDFQSYDSGILVCDAYGLNHGVLLVGYGSENGKDYYIVKNSWGQNWGEKGFVRVSAKKGEDCLIGNYIATADLSSQ